MDSLSLLEIPVLQRSQRIQIELHRGQRAVGADKVRRVARSRPDGILHSGGRVFLRGGRSDLPQVAMLADVRA